MADMRGRFVRPGMYESPTPLEGWGRACTCGADRGYRSGVESEQEPVCTLYLMTTPAHG